MTEWQNDRVTGWHNGNVCLLFVELSGFAKLGSESNWQWSDRTENISRHCYSPTWGLPGITIFLPPSLWTHFLILTFSDKWNRIYFLSSPEAPRSVINVDQRYLSKLWPAAKFGSIFTLWPHQKGQISRLPHPRYFVENYILRKHNLFIISFPKEMNLLMDPTFYCSYVIIRKYHQMRYFFIYLKLN